MELLQFQAKAIVFPDVAEKIAATAEKYRALTIAGVNDTKGFKAVYDARQEVKRARIDVENRRKELKAEALEYCRAIDAAANRLKALLEPIESDLESKEKAIEDEKARIKAEADRKRRERLDSRMARLFAVECQPQSILIEHMDDTQFDVMLAEKTAEYNTRKAEEARIAAEKAEADRIAAEAKAKEEAEKQAKLEAERAEFERQQSEFKKLKEEAAARQREQESALQAERAKIEAEQAAERKRIADEHAAAKAEAERLAAIERQRIAEERAELERHRAAIEAERIAKDLAEQAERDRLARIAAEKTEAERQAALKPIREQIAAYRASVIAAVRSVSVPELGETQMTAIGSAIATFEEMLRDVEGSL